MEVGDPVHTVGEVPRLGGVTNLSLFLDCIHMRGGVPH